MEREWLDADMTLRHKPLNLRQRHDWRVEILRSECPNKSPFFDGLHPLACVAKGACRRQVFLEIASPKRHGVNVVNVECYEAKSATAVVALAISLGKDVGTPRIGRFLIGHGIVPRLFGHSPGAIEPKTLLHAPGRRTPENQ